MKKNMLINNIPSTVMITGATGGFGVAFAHRFAALGCKLVLTSRKKEVLEALLADLSAQYQAQVQGIILDVSDRAACAAALRQLPQEFSDIDCLVNNAGGAFGLDPAYSASLDDWDAMVDVNVKGLMYLTRLVLPRMVERKTGHIINIGSVAGERPYPGGHVYCGVKAFTHQFSHALRADLQGKGVRVSCIEPGLTETPFSLNRFKGDADRAAQVYAHTVPLTAEDVAEAVVWTACLPAHVNINTIEMMPTVQSFSPLAVYRES